MPGPAQILRIVVASPGDVRAERDAVSVVIDQVNRSVAGERGLVLKVSQWEKDASPGFHAQGPQALIDAILRIPECDIFVGIFWKRFGTPVLDAKSGTEHEYKLAYEAWKEKGRPQIFFYFNERSYAPKSKEETDQWGSVLDFKKNFPKEGLWWSYTGTAQFKELLREHLELYLRREFPLGETRCPTARSVTALHQLPPPPGDFTGRKLEIDDILDKLREGTVIVGLQGMAGVGKTTLALALADRLTWRYPDAQLYSDLRGNRPVPLPPVEVMKSVVHAFAPEAQLPESVDRLSPLYRSVLYGRRAILLLDNVRDAEQIVPLLPPKECLLLVTSRAHFTLPGFYAKGIDCLVPEDACKLLTTIAPRLGGVAEDLGKLCGYLPLALRTAGSAVAETGNLTPAEYVHQLAEAKGRLDAVEASLSLSYRLLTPELQTRFRNLSVFPDDFDVDAAAAIWATTAEHAKPTLGALLRYSLVGYDPAVDRYSLHDLVRVFAESQCGTYEHDHSQRHLALHFLGILEKAQRSYLSGSEGELEALRLVDVNLRAIQAGQNWAATHLNQDEQVARLCFSYASASLYALESRLSPAIRENWWQSALRAARQLKDLCAEAGALSNLIPFHTDAGDPRRAIAEGEEAVAILRKLGKPTSASPALGNMGLAYEALNEPLQAIKLYRESLTIDHDLRDGRAEAADLANIGNCYLTLNQVHLATEFHKRALEAYRNQGYRLGEARTLANLGNDYLTSGELDKALDHFERELEIVQALGDGVEIARTFVNLGTVCAHQGQVTRAIQFWDSALSMARHLGARRIEEKALGKLGSAYASLGEVSRSIAFYTDQLAITRDTGNRNDEATALWNLGQSCHRLGKLTDAISYAEAALKIRESIKDPNAENIRRKLAEWKSTH